MKLFPFCLAEVSRRLYTQTTGSVKGVRENGVSCKKPAMSIAEGWLIYVIAGIMRACRVDNLFGFIWILHTSFRCFKRGRCVSFNSLLHFFNALLYKIVTKELQIYWWRPVVCNRDRAQTIQLFGERLSEKVHATIPKGIVGGFVCPVLQRNLKKWHERPWTYVCKCKWKATKVGSTVIVVRNSVLIISHITFRDCRVHIVCDNLSRNSCIQAYHTLRTTFVVVWLKLTLILHLDKSC